MRRFVLHRKEDINGVSGTGIVAQGCQFDNGICALTWLSHLMSATFFISIDVLETTHGHGGATEVVWLDPKKEEKESENVDS